MSYSFEYIDIILLAMIAGFIFLRLRGILGNKSGFEDEMSSQPWFAVGANDVFPEEFKKFFRFPDAARDAFDSVHGDLCEPETWIEMQSQHEIEAPEFFPYPEEVRFDIS